MTELENFATKLQHPQLPIPPLLMMSEPGTFAYATLTQRWPAIAQRMIAENDFSAQILENLEILIQELPYGNVRSLKNDHGSDLAAWAIYLEPWLNQPWINLPWYFAESYFYRRILEATQYFLSSQDAVDPFASQKQASLESTIEAIRLISNQLSDNNIENQDKLTSLIYSDLWGNKADLSLFASITEALRPQDNDSVAATHLLVDDTAIIVNKLAHLHAGRIDFIVDNVGLELVSDLFLADFLLTSHIAKTIYLHLKPHPTFVSDAMIQDVHYTLEVLGSDPETGVCSFADRLKNYIACGQIKLCENFFWTAPLPFWEMPRQLSQELAEADFIFVKGDANYRRLLGDRQWAFTTPFTDIVCYFPTPLVALRTLKAEIAAGLEPSQIARLNSQDPHWLTNGQWGVIQFATPR